MGAFADFDRYDGLGPAELVRTGEVRSSELVEEAISRIETRNLQINAIVFETFESARAAAAAPSAGPFAGVPFLLKDMSASLAGAPMSCGNRVLAKIGMDHDDEIVRRYKGAGLVILGKTNVPEFGLAPVTESEALGPARNPWDLTRHARRLERWLGSGDRRAHCADGAWHGWRRLLAHPGLLLRPVWAKADAWAHASRPDPGRELARLFCRPCYHTVRSRQCRSTRCDDWQ